MKVFVLLCCNSAFSESGHCHPVTKEEGKTYLEKGLKKKKKELSSVFFFSSYLNSKV